MNIFFLSANPRQCARWHCDKHVVKMILESCQMLYTAQHLHGGTANVETTAPLCKTTGKRGYKQHAVKHPSTQWVCESLPHYIWLCKLALELCKEYMYRYASKTSHSCQEHVCWLMANPPPALLTKLKWIRDPTPAMPDEYKVKGDSIASYRAYYNGSKRERGLFKWTRRPTPSIFVSNLH